MMKKNKKHYEFYTFCGYCNEYDVHNSYPKAHKVTTVCCNCGVAKTTKVS